MHKISKRFIKFLFVGALNTLFGYSVFALLYFLGFHYTLAALYSTILGILFNFKTIGKLVFKNHDNTLLIKFIGVYTVNYFVGMSLLKMFDLLKVNMYLASAIILLPLAILGYFLNKTFVFKLNK
jgi:putative flippase GtrA